MLFALRRARTLAVILLPLALVGVRAPNGVADRRRSGEDEDATLEVAGANDEEQGAILEVHGANEEEQDAILEDHGVSEEG